MRTFRLVLSGAILVVFINFISSCQQQDDDWIVGKWEIAFIEPVDTSKVDIGVGLVILGMALSDGMVWSFFDNKTFEAATEKDKEVFSKGTYELTDSGRHIVFKSDDGEKEKKYEIIDPGKDKMRLKNIEDNILMTFVSQN